MVLEVLIFFEHYVNNVKTYHTAVFYWLVNSQKQKQKQPKKLPLKISCQAKVILETPRRGGYDSCLLGYT